MNFEYDENCPCEHCQHISYDKWLKELEDAGGTWYWKDTGETRDCKFLWFRWKEKQQTRIAVPQDAYRHMIVSRWVKVCSPD